MNAGSPLRVVLRPSRFLCAALTGVHTASAALVLALDLPSGVAAALVAALAAHVWWAIRRYAGLASPGAVTGITLHVDRTCILHLRDGRNCPGSADDTTLVTGSLVVLAVSAAGGRRLRKRRAVVAADMLDGEDFRRMRIALRWGQPAPLPGGATQV